MKTSSITINDVANLFIKFESRMGNDFQRADEVFKGIEKAYARRDAWLKGKE